MSERPSWATDYTGEQRRRLLEQRRLHEAFRGAYTAAVERRASGEWERARAELIDRVIESVAVYKPGDSGELAIALLARASVYIDQIRAPERLIEEFEQQEKSLRAMEVAAGLRPQEDGEQPHPA